MSWSSRWQGAAALLLSAMFSPAFAAVPSSERAVLDAFHTSTTGAGWTNRSGWGGAAGTECTWYGISCVNDGTDDHVVAINLPDNNLRGPLPALSGLTELRRFFAYSTNGGTSAITSLPPDLVSLTKLQRFSVAGNGPGLTGALPASLSTLTELESFRVNHNGLTGSLPSLSGLTKLEIFWAHENGFTGPMPTLSGLAALNDFQIHRNQISGSIPALSGLGNLQIFTAYTNQLSGPIPPLSGLGALEAFSAANNQLTGSIPPLAGQGLNSLRRFRVHLNQLTGPIPDLTGVNLESFTVGDNQLTGPIPVAPASLLANDSSLCRNSVTGPYAESAAWNRATGSTPWWTACASGAATPVPTLSGWPLILLGLLLASARALRRDDRT